MGRRSARSSSNGWASLDGCGKSQNRRFELENRRGETVIDDSDAMRHLLHAARPQLTQIIGYSEQSMPLRRVNAFARLNSSQSLLELTHSLIGFVEFGADPRALSDLRQPTLESVDEATRLRARIE